MVRLSSLSRVVTVVLAALQFAAPAIVSVIDGVASKRASQVASHVEAAAADRCTPPHAADCSICRYLTAFRDVDCGDGNGIDWSDAAGCGAAPATAMAAAAHALLPPVRAPPFRA